MKIKPSVYLEAFVDIGGIMPAPVPVRVLAWDRNKYVAIEYEGEILMEKAYNVYKDEDWNRVPMWIFQLLPPHCGCQIGQRGFWTRGPKFRKWF